MTAVKGKDVKQLAKILKKEANAEIQVRDQSDQRQCFVSLLCGLIPGPLFSASEEHHQRAGQPAKVC